MANFNRNSRVSDQIMDYYLRYGQNRDLEKFLRLRSSTTRSSSDGSLPALDELDRREQIAEKLGRSLENLSVLETQEKRKTLSHERLNEAGASKNLEEKDTSETEKSKLSPKQQQPKPSSAEIVVKETKNEKKSGRNFNFNLESVIEIKLPPVPVVQQPIIISPTQIGQVSLPVPVVHEISSTGTQTVSAARSTTEQQTEEPIRPILKPNTVAALNAEEVIDTTRDISPVSSIASNKQKLEWDSLGDIGYDSNEKFYFCGAADLNETEKRCLQKYFAKKGLNLDEKVVVVKNVQKQESKQKDASKEKLKADAKLKWQAVYQKYKDKYSNQSEISMNLMNPEAQSTPKETSQPKVPQKSGKSTQTSLVKIFTKSIQAEKIDTSDKQIGTESIQSARSVELITNSTSSALVANSEQVEVAESFEFYSSPPSQVNPSSAESTMKSSPEITVSTSSSSSSSSSTAASRKQLSNKENKRTPYNFEDELRLGITLYNTICESRSLPARVKQSLIDKIFSKMMKNDPKGRSKEELLLDCGKFKRPCETEKSDAVLSGVEAVGTSGSSSKVASSNRAEAAESNAENTSNDVEEVISHASKEEIVKNLEELSSKSNEAPNPVSKKIPRDYSASSSQGTLSSRQGSSQTAKQMPRTNLVSVNKLSSSERLASDKRIRKAMNEYLKPMTHSEVDYENQQGLRKSLKLMEAHSKTPSSTTHDDRIFELFQKEKQSQLLKLDKKIEHLRTMRLLLLEDQKAVNEIGKENRTKHPVEQNAKKSDDFSEEKENIYANTNQKTTSGGSIPLYTSVPADSTSERSRDQTEYSSATRSDSAWNSHYHMKQIIQNRSKLETPTSDESIAAFIKTRKDKFIENYERHRRQMFEDQHHVYTKPYSGRESKQDLCARQDDKYSVRKMIKPIGKRNFLSSDVFISSDSMSIPAANTLTNTTTHQYDIKSTGSSSDNMDSAKPVATQTTGSILRTKPIFETKPGQSTASVQVPSAAGCQCACNCPCRQKNFIPPLSNRTEIVNDPQTKHDKQQQTKPNSIAYVITFHGDKNKRNSTRSASEKDRVYRDKSSETSETSGSLTRSLPSETTEPRNGEQRNALTLKEQFERNRPGTLSKLKERQKCVNELNKLRLERNKQRKKLLLLTSDDSLKRSGVKKRLPPPPLAQRRIFSSKAIRENTRRQVKKLPEVLRKKEIEKENNLKRKNLILRDTFNRNLQRKVLRGQIDLSNSVRVIQD
ncbi:uncharacterized protein LOC131440362 [Malaya genurostris]|uniref:uncharacterized protein LOC131440362 n=1 Tax=Malaya genurostris TaxID=325434 RepID=UPI0026F3853F|nr:uncharacterized protein LOC131440362 [Malaya genurostris]